MYPMQTSKRKLSTLTNRKRAMLLALTTAVVMAAAVASASAHTITTKLECLKWTPVGYNFKITDYGQNLDAGGAEIKYGLAGLISYNGKVKQENLITGDATGKTITGPSIVSGSVLTRFYNGNNISYVTIPLGSVLYRAIGHKDQGWISIEPFNYNVPACAPPPEPTPPVTPPPAPPVQELVVKVAHTKVSNRCVRAGQKVGYKVYGTGIVDTRWYYANGKRIKGTNGKRYIKSSSRSVKVKVVFSDGTTSTYSIRYQSPCRVTPTPHYTG